MFTKTVFMSDNSWLLDYPAKTGASRRDSDLNLRIDRMLKPLFRVLVTHYKTTTYNHNSFHLKYIADKGKNKVRPGYD